MFPRRIRAAGSECRMCISALPALVSCRRASLPKCSLTHQKAEQRDFRHAVLSKPYKPVLCAAALLEAAFAKVSNMTFYHKLTNSCYRANMPGKTNHRFREMQISSRFCAPSGPMGLPPVMMPHPARILIISSICPWDNNVFFPKIKLFIIRIFA